MITIIDGSSAGGYHWSMTNPQPAAPEAAGLPVGPEEQIAALVIHLASDIEAWITRTVAPLGLTEPQALLIRRLRQPMSMGSAAEALRCDASNLTGIVDRMEGRGLVERRTLPADRRVKELVLTDAGRQILSQLDELATAAPGLSGLSGDEQEALVRLLQRALEPRGASTGGTRVMADAAR
jgi:MarR family transcriptional regulator, organic hydroperoxide resistance regulator